VELNNTVRELAIAGTRRGTAHPVRTFRSDREHREELIYGVENLAMLDLIFAKAKYAEELKASEPILSQKG
jgi:DNA mismatch repair protein MutS2